MSYFQAGSCSVWSKVALLVFLMSFTARAESVINLPRVSSDPGTITGFAFVNPNDQSTTITITAYDESGVLVAGAGITNPAQVEVGPNRQAGELIATIFGADFNPSLVAWFQAVSPADGVTAFFLFLDSTTGTPTLMDGADPPENQRKIFFNQIRVDDAYSTELNIVNTEDRPTRLDLFLVDGLDVFVETFAFDPGSGVDERLQAHAVMRSDVLDLFGVNNLDPGAYILVISDTLIGGFQFVKSPDGDWLGLNAKSAGELLDAICFPQLAVLGPWRMEIGLVNYAPRPVSAIITAYRPDGTLYGPPDAVQNPVLRNLDAGASLREDVEAMFGFAGDDPLEGWVKVETNSRAVNGYVTYGAPATGSLAAVAAQVEPQTQAIFSHIATTQGFFTGVGALNAAAVAANLRIVALQADGTLLGRFDTVLPPGTRIARLLSQLIPQAAGQAGGIIWISSDRPLYLTALFGTDNARSLSNIPPQPAPPDYLPDTGLPTLSIQPAFAAVELNQTRQFQDQDDGDGLLWAVNGTDGGSLETGTVDATGLFTAPGVLPELPVVVSARDDAQELSGAGTVDLVEISTLAGSPGDLTALTSINGTLIAARNATGPAGGPGTAEVVEIADGQANLLASFPNDEISDLEVLRADDGNDYVLISAKGSGRLIRLASDQQTEEVVTGLNEPSFVEINPVSGQLIVADADGLLEISSVRLQADLIGTDPANGSEPRRLLNQTGIGGIAADPCTNSVYYTLPASGELRTYSLKTGQGAVVRGNLDSPGRLEAVFRRDAACGESFHLFISEEAADRVLLYLPHLDLVEPWAAVDSPGAVALNRVAESPGEDEVVVVAGAVGPAGNGGGPRLERVPVRDLYREDVVNLRTSASGSNHDPVSDTHGFEEFQPDIVEASVLVDGDNLNITLYFADTISPCIDTDVNDADPCDPSENPADAVTGFIDLDLDQDGNTGLASVSDLNSPYNTGIGIEFCIDFITYNPDAGGAAAFVVNKDLEFEFVGRFPVTFASRSLSISIPLTALGDDGNLDLAAVFGSPLEPTDVSSNHGFISSQGQGQSGAATLGSAVRPGEGAKFQRLRGASPSAWSRLVPVVSQR